MAEDANGNGRYRVTIEELTSVPFVSWLTGTRWRWKVIEMQRTLGPASPSTGQPKQFQIPATVAHGYARSPRKAQRAVDRAVRGHERWMARAVQSYEINARR